jgi:hypothetical protein
MITNPNTSQIGGKKKQGVGQLHCGLAIYIKKYVNGKRRRIYGNSNISPFKNIYKIFKKNPLNETKILQDIL